MDERRAAQALPSLARLGTLRERRALALSREAEEVLEKATAALEEQRRLIAGIEAELEALVASTDAGPPPTVESFRLAADRRHWLHHDLDMERYYIDTFESDVAAARDAAAAARRRWLREREKASALERRGAELRRDAGRRAESRDSAIADDVARGGVGA